MKNRGSGVIMHITSLPGHQGIGTLGRYAKEFIDFLKNAGQKYWQILPVGPTGYGNSPYQAFSAFAGNPFLIDIEKLIKLGYLTKTQVRSYDFECDNECVDYDKIIAQKNLLLKEAYHGFLAKESKGNLEKLEKFKKDHEWLDNYSLFMALKIHYNNKSWQTWKKQHKLRKPSAINAFRKSNSEEIDFWIFVQFIFYKQWIELRKYANKQGIEIIGDMPIYVSSDSSDTWAHPELFYFDKEGNSIAVAGCPPDAFSDTGQLWGNPLYDWKANEDMDFKWWIKRMKSSMELYDIVRIDHFRGFESYWEIPASDKTAEFGKWVKGPGMKLFDAINKALPSIRIIAEDLGFLTEEVIKLREDSGYPGMKILQFAFDSREESDYLPHNYNNNSIVYTGTHDNDTVMGWFESASVEDVNMAIEYLNLTKEEGYNWGYIRGAWSSVSEIAIAPMQDFLGLGTEHRMNIPSTMGGNWEWRVREEDLSFKLARRMRHLTKIYGRLESEYVEKQT
ncbi:MAG: 4-alpha-glucanotransferase [Acidaminobacteraceae bacterium]